MYIWFRQNQQRLGEEYLAISRLAEEKDWLKDVAWNIEDNTLFLTATIQAHGYSYPIRMDYPLFYPDTPPIVFPQNKEAKWTSHSYRNGILCLEWGPDNWHIGLTGAKMLESTHRLLEIENPLGSDQSVIAPSRHHLTLGQELRAKSARFYLGESLLNYLNTVSAHSIGTFKFSVQIHDSIIAFVHSIHLGGQDVPFEEKVFPEGILGAKTHTGLFIKTNLKTSLLKAINASDVLRDFFTSFGYESLLDSNNAVGLLIMDEEGQFHSFLLYGDNQSEMLNLGHVKSNSTLQQRIPSELATITNKRVGIVGLGSVGSKIALSLARTGVRRFLLVDYDIFLPENLCRNALDWRDVGEHKVEAVKAHLSFISPDLHIEVSKLHLTGQESNSVINGLLHNLTQCDLLIDATASPAVFNLLASAAWHCNLPIVWMEVYAGGVGGMVARSRPGFDPTPAVMRNAYEEILDENGFPETTTFATYSTESPDGEVMVATDADVSVIAGHATRLALDTLLDGTLFPHSMYLIGLAENGFFQQPFDVRPVDTRNLNFEWGKEQQSAEMTPEAISVINEILNLETSESASP